MFSTHFSFILCNFIINFLNPLLQIILFNLNFLLISVYYYLVLNFFLFVSSLIQI